MPHSTRVCSAWLLMCVSWAGTSRGGKKKKKTCKRERVWQVEERAGMREGQMDGERESKKQKRNTIVFFPKLWGASERWRAPNQIQQGKWNAVQMQIHTHTHTHPQKQALTYHRQGWERWRFVLTCRRLRAVKIKPLWWECENNSSGPAVKFGCRNASSVLIPLSLNVHRSSSLHLEFSASLV